MSDLLNLMERFYFKGACSFADVASHNGAATLLFVLGFGVRERERLQENVANKDFQIDLPESI